jgi:signal transduction histidine kinase
LPCRRPTRPRLRFRYSARWPSPRSPWPSPLRLRAAVERSLQQEQSVAERDVLRGIAPVLGLGEEEGRPGVVAPIEAPAACFRRAECDRDRVLHRLLDEGRDALPGGGEDLGPVGDLVRVLLRSLLSNAVKFTAGRDDAVVEVGSAAEDGTVAYFVRDNGIGFDPRYAEKLFGVFQRLHGSDEFEGTGAGLAIARRVVDRHGGWIRAEGEVGRGATFRFALGRPPGA